MLRDVPYCRSILACGMGGLILSVIFLTLVYPLFCDKVSEVKEIKVREYMADRYGISDRSVEEFRSGSDADRELFKAVRSGSTAAAAMPPERGAAGEGSQAPSRGEADSSRPLSELPPAKRR